MISNACATMRTAISFLPLLRPFIIKLYPRSQYKKMSLRPYRMCAPVNQSLDDGHLRLLELLFGVTTSRVRKIDGMADLNVVRERDILHLDTERS